LRRVLKWIAGGATAIVLLYLVWMVYSAGQLVLAVAFLCGASIAFYIYLAKTGYTWRYLFPGIAAMLLFVLFPLLHTVNIGFTNYGSKNLLTFERATGYLLGQTFVGEGQHYAFTLHADGGAFRLRLESKQEGGPSAYVTRAFDLSMGSSPSVLDAAPETAGGSELGPALALREVIARREALKQLEVRFPDGSLVTMAGLREFAPIEPVYEQKAGGTLVDRRTGGVLTPNFRSGFYETADGEQIKPGFKVYVGFENYVRILTDQRLRGPFLAIFLWTITFAGLTVLFTLVVGCTLAVLLNWDALKHRTLYRTLLFLPYAVPGFISILVFRGLFNQHFGEINLILNRLFGIKPEWFADPFLAKCMILIVNTWLGYPYILILCAGLLKAIPSDVYEATAIAGAGPLTNFFRITLPLIIRPLTPLLISSFAFNFNNFVLIALLTRGRPDFLNTSVPAGTNDILVSYTYRIAFEDSGQAFGLASAITTAVFLLVAGLSIINLRLTKANAPEV
jgi:maltose/maltodextrin transport system permease protein